MRRLLPLLLLLLLSSPVAAAGDPAAGNPVAGTAELPPSIAGLPGRTYHYDIAFLWFRRLARGEFYLAPGDTPGIWRAVLDARTLGIAAWLTRDREQKYESLMRLDGQGRLHTIWHSSTIYKGKGEKRRGRTKVYHYDHEARQVRVTVERNGMVTEGDPMPMPDGKEPVDVLTAFFNFRAGVYGPLEVGRRVVVPTFSRKGPSDIVIDILPRSDWPSGYRPEGDVLFCRVTLDQEVFNTGGGHVYVWLDRRGMPLGGVVENVLGMGDVRGTKVREVVNGE
ncbi:uncharacterized protein DUF3108 [Geothermobacter ehrlichii]|uniref:Uncharacterized protein DUF3108 n=1 Tax=Geothermobacter ehrlichii TaxID=213224 RepID=A0A5D3WN58_9BACT|nr:DUF3108 domain-containing protein [Geothermobacter ehrlichii]TYO98765.1 uncharacterized protein DUF3108 [Geothermobacter ehrlichii]